MTPWLPRFCAVVGVLVLLALMGPRPATAAPVPQPAWPAKCPLRVALLLDQSASLDAGFGDVQQASQDLVDALRDHPSEVMVAGFGTAATMVQPLTDVSTKPGRTAVKKAIRDLDTFSDGSGQGATNWEAALQLAESSQVQIAVILTDGLPNVYGSPVQQADPPDGKALVAARAVADRLKKSGTRVVPVGIELGEGGVDNLAAISGPKSGEDYFLTRVTVLRGELYQIAAKSCGVPVSALPTPEPLAFPLRNVVIGLIAGVALLAGAAFTVHRVRGGATPRLSAPRAAPPAKVSDRILRVSDLTADGVTSGSRAPDPGPPPKPEPPPEPEPPAEPKPEQPSRPPTKGRSISLDFLQRPPDGGTQDR